MADSKSRRNARFSGSARSAGATLRAIKQIGFRAAAGLSLLLVAGCKGRTAPHSASSKAVGAAVVVATVPGTLVVLGSSTSAGTGPSDPKNAWVPRYQAYLAGAFPHFGATSSGRQSIFHDFPCGGITRCDNH